MPVVKRENTKKRIIAVCEFIQSMKIKTYNGAQVYTIDYIFVKAGENFLLEPSTIRNMWYNHRHLANID